MVALILGLSIELLLLGLLLGLMECCCDWLNLWCHWLRAQEGN